MAETLDSHSRSNGDINLCNRPSGVAKRPVWRDRPSRTVSLELRPLPCSLALTLARHSLVLRLVRARLKGPRPHSQAYVVIGASQFREYLTRPP